jgi:S-DNA-T family DNA segregation ATPase FtsK/SpoIIIE
MDGRVMSRSEQRLAAFRVIFATVALVVCLLAWIATLTFHATDWPSTSSWRAVDPPENWCGVIGAWLAHWLFYYFGLGAYAIMLVATATVCAWLNQARMSDTWLRFIGMMVVCAAVSTLATMFRPTTDAYLVSGPGGVVGMSLASVLVGHLQTVGTVVTLSCAILVGLVLAADNAVVAFLRWLGIAGKKAAPVIARGGVQAIAGAGAIVAAGGAAMVAGVANVTGRLATAGASRSDAADLAEPAVEKPRRMVRVGPAGEREAGSNGTSGANSEHKTSKTAMRLAEPVLPTPIPPVVDEVDDTPVGAAPVVGGNADDVGEREDDASTPQKPTDVRQVPKVTDLAAKERSAARPMALEFPTRIGNYELPSLAMLEDADPIDKGAIESLCREKAYVLEQTLNEFRLEVQVVAIETGPVITVFELKLSPGIKVSQIASLTNDIARALKAPAVRVVAPLPGKNTIGIEVPNLDKEKVRIKDLIHATGVRSEAFAIPLYLGKDASGAPLVSDLTKMPHLLIAGTTGSGKSVCVGSIVLSVLLTRTPEEVQMILVDPKVVELAMFKDIPHLMCPIVTEMSKAEAILDWAATKMDERYALLAEAGVKDIRSYNKLGKELLKERMQIENDEEMQHIPLKLPYIVLVIDELADLMMTSAKEVEFYLCRIAQKSRAVGIHLIVSTQRPQANVVTGLIKSNLPSRIAFRVASRLDSRIVLDQNGGEVLMGQGDMLFLPPGSSKLLRAQGTYISDEELRSIVKHARAQGQPNYHPELIRMPKAGEEIGERDELFDPAVDIILESGRGSVSLLQRRLTIGYSRASRLVEQMYAAGIVGEYKGSQAREVIVTKDEWQAIKAQRDREVAVEESGE